MLEVEHFQVRVRPGVVFTKAEQKGRAPMNDMVGDTLMTRDSECTMACSLAYLDWCTRLVLRWNARNDLTFRSLPTRCTWPSLSPNRRCPLPEAQQVGR